MKKNLLSLTYLLIALSSTIHAQSFSKRDVSSLKKLAIDWERYWNTHNMDSMGSLLKTNVDFINVAGVWLKGKEAAVADHKQKHISYRFKTSIWRTDSIDIQYIKPDVALMHIKWRISGDFETENVPRPPRQGIFTWVAEKEGNRWLLRAVQNTNMK